VHGVPDQADQVLQAQLGLPPAERVVPAIRRVARPREYSEELAVHHLAPPRLGRCCGIAGEVHPEDQQPPVWIVRGLRRVPRPEDRADPAVQLLALEVQLQRAAAVEHAPQQVVGQYARCPGPARLTPPEGRRRQDLERQGMQQKFNSSRESSVAVVRIRAGELGYTGRLSQRRGSRA
jgi:hypothetical protein